jgi:hypothetical protein
MPTQYHLPNAVEAYRLYYENEKLSAPKDIQRYQTLLFGG